MLGVTGFDQNEFIKVHENPGQITSIRFNPSKTQRFEVQAHNCQPIPWSSFGYYLPERPLFTMDPLLHAGAYYVQEASSMFLEQALKQTTDLLAPLRVLDLCAAPGGKSTLAQSLISPHSLLVSNEVIKTRAGILAENMVKWGSSNVIVTNNDPKSFSKLENYFDIVIVDAPCSGSGLFRKEPEAVKEWSDENVMLCNKRQQRILADIMPALKRDGILLYSTCSYSKEENEDILDWIAEHFAVDSLRLAVEASWGIVETLSNKTHSYGYRFFPDKVKGEGFFIAALKKKDCGHFYFPKSKKTNFEKLTKGEQAITRKWINDKPGIALIKMNDFVHAFPGSLLDDLDFLKSYLYFKKAGTLIGKITAKELIPEHELALSGLINGNLPSIELAKEQALRYLRKEEIKTDAQVKGWCLVRYQHQNLGWIKILQNRANNYYPLAWRIRM